MDIVSERILQNFENETVKPEVWYSRHGEPRIEQQYRHWKGLRGLTSWPVSVCIIVWLFYNFWCCQGPPLKHLRFRICLMCGVKAHRENTATAN